MRYLGIIGFITAGVLTTSAARADVITDWNETAVDVGRKLGLGPNPASRLVAIAQIAVFEAVNSVGHEYRPYQAYVTPAGPVDLEVAAAQAAHDVLLAFAPSQQSNLDDQLATSLAGKLDGAEKTNGIELGFLSASSIYVRRLADGATATVAYPGSTDLGKWRPTPRVPEFTDAPTNSVLNPPLAASDPQWGQVTPFGLASASQFRAVAPPDLTSAEYAAALNEVKDIGSGTSVTRSAEQTEIAKFWAQQTHIPFNDIARTVANREHLSLVQKARLFAVLNIALADARIAVWDTKYTYGYWRPITAIRSADLDGNDATALDATWNSLLDTPNHPEYVSGHSATGAAGAAVLAAVFGDATGFAVHSDTLKNVTRDFDSFSAAATENALSRVYAGIHFRFSNDAGLALGTAVAEYELSHVLLPAAVSGSDGAGGAGGESGAVGEAGAGTPPGAGGNGEAGEPSSHAGANTSGGGHGGAASGSGGRSGGGGGTSSHAGGSATGGRPSGAGTGGGSNDAGGEGGSPATGGTEAKGGSSGKGGASGAAGTSSGSTSKDDSGCNCAVPTRARTASEPWMMGLALLAFSGRRRRTHRR